MRGVTILAVEMVEGLGVGSGSLMVLGVEG